MKTFKAILLSLLFAISFTQVFGQAGLQKYSVKTLQADFDLMRSNFEEIHAGLYLYTSESKLDSVFSAIRSNIVEPLTGIEFYRMLLPLHDYIKNGHTMILPSIEWDEYKSSNAKLFPFDIYWDNHDIYVLKNLSNNKEIQEGDKIVTINGVSAVKVFERMVELWTKDGNNTTFPEYGMMKEFSACYANFFGLPDSFELVYHDGLGDKQEIVVDALREAEMQRNHIAKFGMERMPWYYQANDPVLSLHIENQVAYLTVPSFDQNIKGENGMRFRRYYNYVFEKLDREGIKNLIIDVRENGGGDPQPTIELYSHLTKDAFKVSRTNHTITNRIPNPKFYEENIFYWNMMAAMSLKQKEDKYEVRGIVPLLMGDEKKGLNQPSDIQYEGNVYVLIGGRSFSATGEFAGLLKYNQLATFVGEETGGNPGKLVAGVSPHLILPNTGIKIRMNLIYNEMVVEFENESRGVMPDYYVRNTIDEELIGTDAVKLYAEQLIKGAELTNN